MRGRLGGSHWRSERFGDLQFGAWAVTSAWNRATSTVKWRVSVPVNRDSQGVPADVRDAVAGVTITESGTVIGKNGVAARSAPGVAFDRIDGAGPRAFVVFAVGSGSYEFVWNAQ